MGRHWKIRSERGAVRFSAVSMVRGHPEFKTKPWRAVRETVETLRKSGVRVSRASLYRWLRAYARQEDASALETAIRHRARAAVSPELLAFLVSCKEHDPVVSIPEVLRLARASQILPPDGQTPHRSTLYREARSTNVELPRRHRVSATARPFSYAHSMQMVLCDGKHFRAGSEKVKRVAFFFLDDCTRYALDVVVGSSETASLFLRGLHSMLRHCGLPKAIYLDKGSGFTAHVAQQVAASLKIPLIFGATRYPQGHGKVERFHGTAMAQCLRGLAKPGIDPHCESLRVRIKHYLDTQYNKAKHSITERVPADHFDADHRAVFPDDATLDQHFLIPFERKVRRDNVVEYAGSLYEVPAGHAQRRVKGFHNVLTGDVFMVENSRLMALSKPDLVFNARERRKSATLSGDEDSSGIVTAAELRFSQENRSIVDADGGFSSTPSEENEDDGSF